MELRKISICNLNSLKGEFCIDFTSGQLRQQDIFAITGHTGSGKSTILDAITLALYNRVPRLDGKSGDADKKSDDPYKRLKPEDTMNSLSRGTREGYAKVDFEASGQNYRAEWICTLKTKNFSGTHSLYRIENESGQQIMRVLSTGNLVNEFNSSGAPKEGSVSEKIVDLIGLGYDQFCKACILAQNSFASFLKADDYEKAAILEKITGTFIYGRIADVIVGKRQAAEEEKTQWDTKIGEQKIHLIEDEGVLNSVKAEKEALVNKKTALEKEIEEIRKGLDWWQTLQTLTTNREAAEKEKTEKEDAERLLLPDKSRLDRYDGLSDGLKLLGRENDAKREHSTAEENAADAQRRLDENKRSIQHKKDVEKKAAQEELDEKKSVFDKLARIKPVKENIGLIRNEYGRLDQAVRELRSAADRYAPESGYGRLDEASLLETAGRWTEGLESDMNPDTLNGRVTRAQREMDLCGYAETLSGQMEQVRQLDGKDAEARDLINSLTPLHDELDGDVKRLANHIRTLEDNDYIIKRGLLVEGQPCELCGATHHPYATASVFNEELAALKGALEEKKKRFGEVDGKIDAAKQAINVRSGERRTLNASINGLKNKVLLVDDSFRTVFSSFNPEEQIRALKAKAGELKKWEDDKAEAERLLSRVGLRNLLQKAASSKDILNKNLPEGWYARRLADRAAFIPSLESDIRNYDSAEKAFKDADTKVKGIERDIETLSGLTPGLEEELKEKQHVQAEKKKPYDEAVEALSAWIEAFNAAADTPVSREELAALKEDKTDWKSLRNRINDAENSRIEAVALFKRADEELTGHREKEDKPSETKDELEMRRDTANSELKGPGENSVESRLAAVSGRLVAHVNAEKTIAGYKTQLADAKKKLELWNRFYKMLGAHRGDKDAKEFRMIAQNYTLGLLLDYANIELRKYTNNRYSLKKQNDSTLEIMVVDGELGERYASSLSGGETFMVSLALALGLSNISSGSVSIKNLFIDEGFGSLDGDTQDVVVDALNSLRTQGKRIGIISHTAALLRDDGIYKIRIEKNEQDDKFSVIRFD